MNQNNDNRRRREQRTVPSRRPVSEARVPVLVDDDPQERVALLQEAVGLLEELVDDVFEADDWNADACRECASRLDPLIAVLKAMRDRLAHAERERERLAHTERERDRLTRLAAVRDREFHRVPGWPAYDVDRAGSCVRSYYSGRGRVSPTAQRVLVPLVDRETGVASVKLWHDGESRELGVIELARWAWTEQCGSASDARRTERTRRSPRERRD